MIGHKSFSWFCDNFPLHFFAVATLLTKWLQRLSGQQSLCYEIGNIDFGSMIYKNGRILQPIAAVAGRSTHIIYTSKIK